MKKTKVFDECTFKVSNRILVKLNKKDLKDVLINFKENDKKIEYLISVFHFYNNDLLEIFTNYPNDDNFDYLIYFFKDKPKKENIAWLFYRTSKETLKVFFENCLIPCDDFYEITISLKNELKEESKFLDNEEFDIVFKNEVLNNLKNYSYHLQGDTFYD